MDVTLVVVKGGTKGKSIRLRSEETIVGRRNGCDLRIPSAAVSRRHCRLSFRDQLLLVEDLDSVNGTYVNGKRIKNTQPVHPGDQLQIGPLVFVVKYEAAAVAVAEEEDDFGVSLEVDDEDVPVMPVVEVEESEDVETLEDVDSRDTDEERPAPKPQKKVAPARKTEARAKTEKPPAKPKPPPKKPEPEPATLEFVDDSTWHVAGGDDLRDLLSQMDEGQEER